MLTCSLYRILWMSFNLFWTKPIGILSLILEVRDLYDHYYPKEIKAGLSAASAKYIISAVHVLFSLANHIYSGYTAKDTKTHHKLF
jgi:hypothetical protein